MRENIVGVMSYDEQERTKANEESNEGLKGVRWTRTNVGQNLLVGMCRGVNEN